MLIRTPLALPALAVAAALLVSAAGATGNDPIPADFSTTVDNRFFPLSTLQTLTYEGEEEGDGGETIETRGVITVLAETRTVAGVTVLVARDEAFADGELVESTLDYFAQHRDGTVHYFGEEVDNYEDGQLVDHEGSWLAGEGQNLPGIFMPAQPVVGATFEQERAPGIAEDESEIVAINQSVTVPAGSFTGCIETEDFDPLGNATESKWYCPGVGLVRERGDGEFSELVSYTKQPAATPTAAPATPAATPPAATQPAGAAAPVTAPSTGTGPLSERASLTTALLAVAAAAAGIGFAAWGLARRRVRQAE